MSSREVLATGMPAADGFVLDEIYDVLRIVSFHPNLSLDLSEVNPRKEGSKKTISIAKKALQMLLCA